MVPDNNAPETGVNKGAFDNVHLERQIGSLKFLPQIRQGVERQGEGVR